MITTTAPSKPPSLSLRTGAIVLPILKCLACPACLSIWGSLLAGARLGFLEDEDLHGGIILAALVADAAILWASFRHHARRGPLFLCGAGAIFAVAGHFTSTVLEYSGFAILLAAGIWNAIILRRHHREGATCCDHGQHAHTAVPERSTA